VNTERVKKSFRLPFFYHPLFVCLLLFRHSSLFLSTLAFYRFYRHTHTHRIKSSHRRASSERERERKKDHHGEERGNTLCFVCDVQQKKRKRRKKTFALREMMMRKAHFFLTYSFPFRGGHPFFERMTMRRASRTTTTTTTTTTTLCASLQRERVRH
jgi:hypothetical protein